MGAWDFRILEWVNGWPQSWNPFLKFFSVALNQGWVKIGLGLMIVAMVVRSAKSRKAVILALLAVGLANTLTNVWKEGVPMNRPFQDMKYRKLEDDGSWGPVESAKGPEATPYVVKLRVGHSDSKGTASAHSANMAALAFAMCYFLRRWGIPWVAVALLTGVSRTYTGAHYPSQVLLGWACGVFAALVVIKTWEAFVSARSGVQSGEENEEPELA